jgi:hypothetical protein
MNRWLARGVARRLQLMNRSSPTRSNHGLCTSESARTSEVRRRSDRRQGRTALGEGFSANSYTSIFCEAVGADRKDRTARCLLQRGQGSGQLDGHSGFNPGEAP